ncbi:MAG: ABC transporter permease, partial [Sulfobacillus sp.]
MVYLLRKFMFLLATLWAAMTINFVIPRLMPGNPAEAMLAKFHGRINPSALKAKELTFGVSHKPLWYQYVAYLSQTIHGHFGLSVAFFPATVSHLIGKALPWTLLLVGTSTVISFIIGNMLGVIAAWRRNEWIDVASTTISTFTSAFPYFWLALLLLYVFGFVFNWFPDAYAFSNSLTPTVTLGFMLNVLWHATLPALTIIISSIGGWLLTIRNNMMGVLGEDYVLLARAKGLLRRQIMYSYAARNAILPNITAFAMSLGFMVSGTVLTEIVFSYPGIGFLLYSAVQSEDYALMQAIFLIIVVCVLAANFLSDIILVLIDPR